MNTRNISVGTYFTAIANSDVYAYGDPGHWDTGLYWVISIPVCIYASVLMRRLAMRHLGWRNASTRKIGIIAATIIPMLPISGPVISGPYASILCVFEANTQRHIALEEWSPPHGPILFHTSNMTSIEKTTNQEFVTAYHHDALGLTENIYVKDLAFGVIEIRDWLVDSTGRNLLSTLYFSKSRNSISTGCTATSSTFNQWRNDYFGKAQRILGVAQDQHGTSAVLLPLSEVQIPR